MQTYTLEVPVFNKDGKAYELPRIPDLNMPMWFTISDKTEGFYWAFKVEDKRIVNVIQAKTKFGRWLRKNF